MTRSSSAECSPTRRAPSPHHSTSPAAVAVGTVSGFSRYQGTVPNTAVFRFLGHTGGNTRNVDPECNLTVALETRQAPLRAAISNNIGLGGHNGAVVLRHWTGK